ncbi:MAG: hypothetical protein PVF07_07785 [Thiogranum sp.]|jgi:hypothetical protein
MNKSAERAPRVGALPVGAGTAGIHLRPAVYGKVEPMMKWLDRIPYSVLLPLAAFLTFAPFVPEPHLWQKLKMLFAGTLVKPIDIFDLFLHGTPLLALILKLLRETTGRRAS